MTGTRFVTPYIEYTSFEGRPYAGGKLYFFEGSTSTPLTTFQDADLTIPNTHPIILDERGSPGNVFLTGSPLSPPAPPAPPAPPPPPPPPPSVYQVIFFDTCCHFWYSIDGGVTYTEGETPPVTMHDEWTDLEFAFNDEDFDNFVAVDQTVSAPAIGSQGGIILGSLSTLASTPSGTMVNYGTNPFGHHANGDTTSLNAAYSSTANKILMCIERTLPFGPTPRIPRISNDGGSTWSDTTLSSTGGWMGAAFNQGASIAYIHEYQGHVWKSVDGGSTWSELLNSPVYSVFTGGFNQINTYRMRCNQVGDIVATISGNFGLFNISTDGGTSWTETDLESMATGISSGSAYAGDIGMTLDGFKFVAMISGPRSSDSINQPWVWTSDDGITWTEIFPPWGVANGRAGLVCNISQNGLCITIGYDAVADGVFHTDISYDAGATWTTITFGPQADILTNAYVVGTSPPPPPPPPPSPLSPVKYKAILYDAQDNEIWRRDQTSLESS